MNVMDAKTALLEAKAKGGNRKRAEFNLANAQQTYEREKRKYNDLMEQLDQLEIERIQLSDKYNLNANVGERNEEMYQQSWQQATPELPRPLPRYSENSNENDMVLNDLSKNMDDLSNSIEDFNNNGTN